MTFHTTGLGDHRYQIQRTFLASVSNKLAERCSAQNIYLNISNEGFRIFLAWLLYDNVSRAATSQLSLAQAWNFGATYEMPTFQDAVMLVLVPNLQDIDVCPLAVLEAYSVTERDTLLQRAFVAQLAIYMVRQAGHQWEKKVFTSHKLQKVPDFYLDLTQAMCVNFDHTKCAEGCIEAEDFLCDGAEE